MTFIVFVSFHFCTFNSKIVLVAIQDAGSNHGPAAFDALKRLGASDPILNDFRGSYALVGYARENKPSWIAQQQAHSGQGPSEISLKVPLIPSTYEFNTIKFILFGIRVVQKD